MATGDFMYDSIPAFCCSINTAGVGLQVSGLISENVYVYGVLIIGVSLYQIAVLEISGRIAEKITKQ
jgi:hypothetical protein